jgi:hypothetical protein
MHIPKKICLSTAELTRKSSEQINRVTWGFAVPVFSSYSRLRGHTIIIIIIIIIIGGVGQSP